MKRLLFLLALIVGLVVGFLCGAAMGYRATWLDWYEYEETTTPLERAGGTMLEAKTSTNKKTIRISLREIGRGGKSRECDVLATSLEDAVKALKTGPLPEQCAFVEKAPRKKKETGQAKKK